VTAADALRAGELGAELVGADLWALGVADQVLIQRIYLGVRDPGWATAPLDVREREVERAATTFRAQMRGRATIGQMRLDWELQLQGAANSIRIAFAGRARSDFLYNRIGLCAHYDVASARDRPYTARTARGRVGGRMPEAVFPQIWRDGSPIPAIAPFTELAIEHRDGLRSVLSSGDAQCELEDQRNWADLSFKAYPTSLGRPPFQARAGERFEQSISVRLELPRRPRPVRRPRRGPRVIEVGDGPAGRLPAIGVGPAERLSSILAGGFTHVRLDVDGRHGGEPRQPADGVTVPLELGVLLGGDHAAPALTRFAGRAVARVLAARADGSAPDAATVESVRAAAASAGITAPIFAATTSHYSELNRAPDTGANADGLAWSVCPQVHAFDDRSIIENVAAVIDQVATARQRPGGARCAISGLRLAPLGAADERTGTAFEAAWLIAVVACAARAEVESITYQPQTADADSSVPTALARLANASGAATLATSVSPGEPVAAVATSADGRVAVLLANLRGEPTELRLALPRGCRGVLGSLTHRGRHAGALVQPGSLTATLEPYEAVSVEFVPIGIGAEAALPSRLVS
jgi:D-apionolactonase